MPDPGDTAAGDKGQGAGNSKTTSGGGGSYNSGTKGSKGGGASTQSPGAGGGGGQVGGSGGLGQGGQNSGAGRDSSRGLGQGAGGSAIGQGGQNSGGGGANRGANDIGAAGVPGGRSGGQQTPSNGGIAGISGGNYNSGIDGSRFGGASTQAPGAGAATGRGAGTVAPGTGFGGGFGSFKGPGVNDLNNSALNVGLASTKQITDRVPQAQAPATSPQYYEGIGGLMPRGANMPTQQDVLNSLSRRGATMEQLATLPGEAFDQPTNFDPNFNSISLPSTSQYPNTYAPGENTYAQYNSDLSGMSYNPPVGGVYGISQVATDPRVGMTPGSYPEQDIFTGANSGQFADVGPLSPEDIYAQNTGFVTPNVVSIPDVPYVGAAGNFDYWNKGLNPLSGTATAGVLASPSAPVAANVQPQNYAFTDGPSVPVANPYSEIVAISNFASPTRRDAGQAAFANPNGFDSLAGLYGEAINPSSVPVANVQPQNYAFTGGPSVPVSNVQPQNYAFTEPASVVSQNYAFKNPYMTNNKIIDDRIAPDGYTRPGVDTNVTPVDMAAAVAPQYLGEIDKLVQYSGYTPPDTVRNPAQQYAFTEGPSVPVQQVAPTVTAQNNNFSWGSATPSYTENMQVVDNGVPSEYDYTPPGGSPSQDGEALPDPDAPPTKGYIGPYDPNMDANGSTPPVFAQGGQGYTIQPTSGPPPSSGGGGQPPAGGGGGGGGTPPADNWFNAYYNNPPYQTVVPTPMPTAYVWDPVTQTYISTPATT